MTADRPHRSPSRLLSFRYAIEGWWYLIRSQPNAQIHALAAIAAIAMGIWLGVSSTNWALLVVAIGMVFIAEFVNSAIEAVVDVISPDIHPMAKVAKDTAAGAVLFAVAVAVAIGLLVLGPPLWEHLRFIGIFP